MPVLGIVLAVVLALATVVALTAALAVAAVRLRAVADRVLSVRDEVAPQLTVLRADAARARAHAERLRSAGLRGDGVEAPDT